MAKIATRLPNSCVDANTEAQILYQLPSLTSLSRAEMTGLTLFKLESRSGKKTLP